VKSVKDSSLRVGSGREGEKGKATKSKVELVPSSHWE